MIFLRILVALSLQGCKHSGSLSGRNPNSQSVSEPRGSTPLKAQHKQSSSNGNVIFQPVARPLGAIPVQSGSSSGRHPNSQTVTKQSGSSSVGQPVSWSPGSIPVRPHVSKSEVQVIAFGDFGTKTRMMTRTMDLVHSKFIDPDMVFLLGDNSYGKLSDPRKFDIFFDYVARNSQAPHYAILGNHEHKKGSVNALLELPRIDSRWKLPANYYFEKFYHQGFTICTWFLDTENFIKQQSDWLDASINSEKHGCTWLIVNGHHPTNIQGSGRKFKSKYLLVHKLQPILDNHEVHLYLCGHHHTSQHLITPQRTDVFIVGQIMGNHDIDQTYNPESLKWRGPPTEPAVLELKISALEINYAFYSGFGKADAAPIYKGTISH